MINRLKNITPPVIGNLIKKTWLRLRGLYYTGDKFECPVCEHKFRTFLPGGFDLPVILEKQIIGGGYRKNDICPLCQSTDRDRLIYVFLKNKTNLLITQNMLLHVAPEPTLYKRFKRNKNIQYFPVTKYQEGLYYENKLPSADLLDLSFEGETFDWVICNHVLEHIEDDAKAMSEIYRVLKPGGKALLQVPISFILDKTYENPEITTKEGREVHFGQFDHVRIYGNDYVQRLATAGFLVEVIEQEKELSTIQNLKKFALNPKEKLFLCTRPDYKSHAL
ncbi:MAG: methyltransferase domain-containing protein [Bacteroidales bacterium]|nr:methyltransferase domain-containing protein [Bacteroidales bacterium]